MVKKVKVALYAFLILIAVAIIGFIAPYMVSAKSDLLVIAGFGLLVYAVISTIYSIKKLLEMGNIL